MSVSYECCVLSDSGLVQRIPTKCRVSKECDLESSTMRRFRPIRVGETQEKIKVFFITFIRRKYNLIFF